MRDIKNSDSCTNVTCLENNGCTGNGDCAYLEIFC